MTSTGTKPKFGEVWQWDSSEPHMVIGPGDEEGIYWVLWLNPPESQHIRENYWPPHTYGLHGNWKRLRAVDE